MSGSAFGAPIDIRGLKISNGKHNQRKRHTTGLRNEMGKQRKHTRVMSVKEIVARELHRHAHLHAPNTELWGSYVANFPAEDDGHRDFKKHVKKASENGKEILWLVKNGNVIGESTIAKNIDADSGSEIDEHPTLPEGDISIFVPKKLRGKKYGTLLLSLSLDEMAKNGMKRAVISVSSKDHIGVSIVQSCFGQHASTLHDESRPDRNPFIVFETDIRRPAPPKPTRP